MKTEAVDVCVIGSGAGGAVIAHQAARRGLSTLVVERGPYVRSSDMTAVEAEMVPRLYKDGGLQMNTGVDFFILQGSCVGGSTVVSNMVLMRALPETFAEWSRLGAGLDVDQVERAYAEVEQTLGACRVPDTASSLSAKRFAEGARAIGLKPERMMKALGACVGCGDCNIGCTFGVKRSALTTYVRWAEDAGARVLADTEVTAVRVRKGRVQHVDAVTGADRSPLRIVARTVVVSAGAIGSSALLLASGVGKNVGTRLSFNVGAMVVADFDEVLDAYDADQMTTYLKGDDFLIEATHNPLMSAALTTPGWNGEHSELMRRWRHLAYAGAMVGSEATGRVVQSRWTGQEETRFSATPRDMASLRNGLKTIARCYFAAKARRVVLPTETFTALDSEVDLGKIDERVRTMRDIQCGSSHPQGGNPMSDDPELGVVDTRFAVHGVDGLFVCDGSVFPSALGVNPMHTILALAHVGAPAILASA